VTGSKEHRTNTFQKKVLTVSDAQGDKLQVKNR